MGPTSRPPNFLGAVIDERAFARDVGDRPRQGHPASTIVAGGTYDDSEGWFVRPTVVGRGPRDGVLADEYFGPILSVHVYPDDGYDEMLAQMESAAPYAPDRRDHRPGPRRRRPGAEALRFAAGNFYVNDYQQRAHERRDTDADGREHETQPGDALPSSHASIHQPTVATPIPSAAIPRIRTSSRTRTRRGSPASCLPRAGTPFGPWRHCLR